jgi:hypothetical protein
MNFLEDDVEYFVVIYPFQTSNTDEISLDVGTTVSVIDNKPSGWSWVANQDGDTGWFPTQYLALVDADNGPEESGVSNNALKPASKEDESARE